jgi:hypothetical protein
MDVIPDIEETVRRVSAMKQRTKCVRALATTAE